ncbi:MULTISPECIES: ornithine carbamoyltransferase [Mammaliicoccus]|uniref:ornithine carbamoyltransferase n=1 Tax=Mammaliicoccus TaxID=2803850 RepID=UPI000991955C|nr:MULTISPECIES: ornithine carbamoyltransferase [Mammaliicoccus]HCN59835.1 ornithine carbamoyltransferase [Staphylococcus sp.]MBO3061623.1 ornithine carbamoyltransferase [Mammaliicoccus fleurettii]MBW0765401.1 ornithine carbamoyltransferase [Mammaliicoccus fleurettii]MDT3994392.1 ornithine carbamoyltransferase [Mammaliicoccus fleurettii]MEB6201652.1 ornithine carbamoyltransferase [Mammaliicoccus fleurettii]
MLKELNKTSFLKEVDFSKEELETLIDLAIELKFKEKHQIPHRFLSGKHIALLFEKQSTRTRSAFTVAATKMGANISYLGKEDLQLGKKESVEDTAIVLGSMFDGIAFRGYEQKTVEDLAKYSKVPVWNGLTNEWHPTQMLADFLTIKEHFGTYEGKTLTFIGDGRNNIANSLLVTSAILGVNIHIVAPKELHPNKEIQEMAKSLSEKSQSEVLITDDIQEGIYGSDVIYTDVWCSMGEEDKLEERFELLKDYQVNQNLINLTGKNDTLFLHCLPAIHDLNTEMGALCFEKFGVTCMEVTDDVFRSDYSKVFQQAENRMHTIKALLATTCGEIF